MYSGAASGSSSSTTGIQTGAYTFGAITAGSQKAPAWVLPTIVALGVVVAVVFIIRK